MKKVVQQWKCKTPNWAKLLQTVFAILTAFFTGCHLAGLPVPIWLSYVAVGVMALLQFMGKPVPNNYPAEGDGRPKA